MLYLRRCNTPVGELTLVASRVGMRQLLWSERAKPASAIEAPSELLDEAERQLSAYFDGALTRFDLALDLLGTDFQLQAWSALGDVPYGETITYAEQALRLGRPRAARAVGAANGRNPLPIILPCHRIVGARGSLVGFGGGLARKRLLLEHEMGLTRLC